jgi:MFS family permease
MNSRNRYPWTLVGLLWVVALLNYLDRQMLATMKPSMQMDIQELQSATNFGYLMAVFLWIYGLVSPFAGAIADRVNRKWLITISLFIWSAVTLAMGFAKTFDQLYWLRALMGVSEALYIPAGLALIAEHHTDKTRSLAVGIHMTGLYLGQALGGFGAAIADSFSWNQTFFFFGLIGMLYSLLLVLFLKDDKRPVHADSSGKAGSLFSGFRILLSNVSFWVMLLYFTIPSLPGWAVKNWLPTLFSENLDIKMSLAGPLSTITTAGSSLVGVLLGGWLSDRWLQRTLRGRIYTSVIGLTLTIPALVLIGTGHTLFHVLGAAFCFGFGFGMFDANNMPILCQFVTARHRSTAYGLMNMTGIISGALITNWLGKSTDAGNLGRDFTLLAAVVVVAVVLQLSILRPKSTDLRD